MTVAPVPPLTEMVRSPPSIRHLTQAAPITADFCHPFGQARGGSRTVPLSGSYWKTRMNHRYSSVSWESSKVGTGLPGSSCTRACW